MILPLPAVDPNDGASNLGETHDFGKSRGFGKLASFYVPTRQQERGERGGSERSKGGGRIAVRSTTVGVAPIEAAWLSVRPVTAKASMPIIDTAALIQCQLCSCRSHHARQLRLEAGREAEGEMMERPCKAIRSPLMRGIITDKPI